MSEHERRRQKNLELGIMMLIYVSSYLCKSVSLFSLYYVNCKMKRLNYSP